MMSSQSFSLPISSRDPLQSSLSSELVSNEGEDQDVPDLISSGKHQRCYVWTTLNAQQFMTWWNKTHWYQQNDLKPSKQQ